MANASIATLIERADKKRKELQKRRGTDNPEGRITGYTLLNLFIAVTGRDPFRVEEKNGRFQNKRIKVGLCEREYKNSSLFSTKLHKNRKDIEANISVLQDILPSLTKEDGDRLKDYHDQKKSLQKLNAGVDEPENLSQEELQSLMVGRGNKQIYDNALSKLDKEFKDVIERKNKIIKERDETLRQPLFKCDFDLMTEQDVASSGISEQEIMNIDPMLDF